MNEIKTWIRQDHFDDELPIEDDPKWEMITKLPRFYRLKVEGGWLLYTREKNNVSFASAMEFITDPEHTWMPTEDDLQEETRENLPRQNRKHHHFSLKIPGGKVYRVSSGGYEKPVSIAMTKTC